MIKTADSTKTVNYEAPEVEVEETKEELTTLTVEGPEGPIEIEVPKSLLDMEPESLPVNSFYLGDFDRISLESFLEFSKQPGPKDVFVVSGGGSYAVCCILIDIINRNPQDYTIKIAEFALSAGFYIMLHTTCKIEEIGTQFHLPLQVMQHGMQYAGKLDKKHRVEMERGNDKLFSLIEHVLTSEQIAQRHKYVTWTRVFPFMKRFLNDDIYLSTKQLKELFGERITIHE